MSKLRSKFIAVLAVLFCALLVLSTALFIPKNEKVAKANAATSLSYNIVDTNTHRINYKGLKELFAALTGNSTQNTYDKVEDLFTSTKTTYSAANLITQYGKEYNVLFGNDKVGKDIKWIPAYLSKDENKNIILTLYLSESTDMAVWSVHKSSSEGLSSDYSVPYPSAIYSTSYIRAYINGSKDGDEKDIKYSTKYSGQGGLTTLTDRAQSDWVSFINAYSEYIVAPKYVKWQETESAITQNVHQGKWCFVNEAWGTPIGRDGNPQTGTDYWKDIRAYQYSFYSDWSADKLWLASVTEAGSNGLWDLSENQRKNSKVTGLRTAGSSQADLVWHMTDAGVYTYDSASAGNEFAVRPAFHFNITKAMELSAADVNATYNGSEQRIEGTSGIAETNATAAPWYDKEIFNSVYMTFKYEHKETHETIPQNAGKYKVTIEFTQAGINAGLKWKTPSASDPNKKEINLTIDKKPLQVTFLNNSGTAFDTSKSVTSGIVAEYPVAAFPQSVIDGQIYEYDKPGGANEANYPKLRIKYTGDSGYNSYDIPTIPGTYRATAEIENDCNYSIAADGSHQSYVEFTVVAYKVAVPTLAVSDGSTLNVNDFGYDGKEHSVNIPLFDTPLDSAKQTVSIASYSDLVTVTAVTADTLSYDGTTHTAKAKNAATYKLIANLKNAATMEWADGSGSAAKELTFTIKKAPLELSFADGGNDASINFTGGEWGRSTTGSVKFLVNVSGEVNGEQVELNVYYTNKDGKGSNPADKSGNIYSIPLSLDKGTGYLLCAELDSTKAINKNYEIVNNGQTVARIEKPFKITTSGAIFTKDDIVWGYTNPDINNGNDVIKFEPGNKVVYNGKMYTVTVENISDLTAAGVMVDVTYAPDSYGYKGDYSGRNVKTYTVNIRIVARSADYEYDDMEVTFTWTIEPATFELSTLNSSVKWGYTARGSEVKEYDEVAGIPYEGGGTDGTIVMMIKEGLPSWIVPNYNESSCSGSAVGNGYTAVITGFTSNDNNYVLSTAGADWLTRDWKIVPRTLSTSDWTVVDYANGKVTVAPKLKTSPYSPYLDYKYYSDKDRTTELTFDQLTYTDGVITTYYVWAYVVSSDANNWILGGEDNPHGFNVGKAKDAVDITITAGGEYDGTAKEATITLLRDVTGITLNSFDITYYKVGSDNPLGGAPTDAGKYRAVVTLKPVFAENFYISSGNELNFEITTRFLDVPVFSGTLTYDGTEQDVATLCGLPDDWENYLDVTIAGLSGNTDTVVKNKGRYSVTFSIKDKINDKASNVEWKTDSSAAKFVPQTVYITVEQLVLNAKKWNENKYYSRIEFDNDDAEKFVVYKVYDANGAEVNYSDVLGSVGEMFTVEVSVGTEHGDNVIIKYFSGVTARHVFWTDGGEDPIEVAVPTIADLVFNGDNQTFVIDYGKFADYIEPLGDDKVLTQFNVGEYSIYVTIKTGKNAVWAGTDKNRDPVELKFKMNPLILEDPKVAENQKFTYTGNEITAILNIDGAILARFLDVNGAYSAINAGDYHFTLSIKESFTGNVVWANAGEKSVDWEIEKAKISVKWTDSEVPELDIPEEFEDLDVEYVFTDENGNEVSKDKLEPGKRYTVTAKLKDNSSANYEFVDDSGKTLKNPAKTDGFGFEIKNKNSSFPWWIIALIAGVLLLLAVLIVVLVKRRQTADGDDEFDDFYDDFDDDEYDFDEDIEEDFDDDFGDEDF